MSERLLDWLAALRRWRFRPERGRISATSRWTCPLFPILLLVAILIPYNVLYHLAYLWGLLLLAAWAWVRYQGPRFDIVRDTQSDWAQVGDELEERWELHNDGVLPLLWVELDDASTLPGYSARRVAACGPLGVAKWTTDAVCRRRGRYRLGPLAVRLSDPLGLFSYQRAVAATREMLIYPPLVRLPTLERPRGQRGGIVTASLLNVLPTPSSGGIRDYRAGDPLSYVHWRAVARTGKLMVKEFDQEIAGAVWIVLDLARAPQSGSGEDATEELGIVLACSLANFMLAEGRTVGLFARAAARHIVRPGRGRQHLWEFMSTLVDAHADGETPLHEALAEFRTVAPGQPAVVIITPESQGEWVGPLASVTGGGSAALALLMEATGGASSGVGGRLGQFGIRHSTFRAGEPLPLLTAPRQRKPAYRISPLGRAVRVETSS